MGEPGTQPRPAGWRAQRSGWVFGLTSTALLDADHAYPAVIPKCIGRAGGHVGEPPPRLLGPDFRYVADRADQRRHAFKSVLAGDRAGDGAGAEHELLLVDRVAPLARLLN